MEISEELQIKYVGTLLKDIESSIFTEKDWYLQFLNNTDYVIIKMAECKLESSICDEDYQKIVDARKFARHEINKLL